MKCHRYALVAAALFASFGAIAQSGSITSKIESLGKMEYLEVTDMRAAIRNNLLTVQAEITNKDRSNQRLFYRFKWLDPSGFAVGGEEPWKHLVIYGKQKQEIQTVAPTPAARDFRLQVQSPDNTTHDPVPSNW